MRIDYMLLGYAELEVSLAQATAFLNVCRAGGFAYHPLPPAAAPEGTAPPLTVRCRLSVFKPLTLACGLLGVSLTVRHLGGLPHLAWRYRRRAGLALGVLLGAALMFCASRTVWDVRVSGEGDLSAPALTRALEECGLSVGSWIPALDTDEVEGRLLRSDAGVAWVTVNMKGTVAYVQVRPLLTPAESGEDEAAANLIATREGVVEQVKLMAGEAVVKVGDVVRPGQLLISGVRDVGEEGYALTAARGEVLARTTHTLEIKIPQTEDKKVDTGVKKCEKTLFFFGKSIKVTKSTGILGGSCDTIKRLEVLSLPDGTPLPVSVETVEYREYTWQTVRVSLEEAERAAYEELGRALTRATAGGELLSRSVQIEQTEDALILRCQYTVLENIAVTLPMETGE